MKHFVQSCRHALAAATWLLFAVGAGAQELPEYRLKAAFIFNFMAFTEWPSEVGSTLNLCIYGIDPFGPDIDGLQGKVAAGRTVAVQRKALGQSLAACQAVFITTSAIQSLPRVLESVKGRRTLTIADSPGAMQRGAAINMNLAQDKVTFEANLIAARNAGLNLSSKLLRLATEVLQ